jgi:hypothetical protein
VVSFTVLDAGAEGRRRLAEPMMIVQPDRRIRLNAEASNLLQAEGATRVLVLWDQAARKIALSITQDSDKRGYRLGYNARGGAKFTAKAFLGKIGWKANIQVRLPVKIVNGMLEAVLPVESLKTVQKISKPTMGPKTRRRNE